ncbi:extracellular solute-binding protein [Paenibacillus hodogayensis]|uniref:Extracellular solute-binding protein n=1 Tax=Paenibacillus hodogayensis TaxID=279208 RepID=A0ABV5VSN0_9BACL
MNKLKRATLPVLIATLTVGAVGCSNGKSATPAPQSDPNEVVNILFLTPGAVKADAMKPDNRIIAEIEKRLKIKLKVQTVLENNFEKINVAMASGDLPDVVTINYPSTSVNQWIDQGLIVPLNDYLPSLPTLKNRLEGRYSWTAVDGKFYGYPFIEEQSNVTMTYRADWLEALGLKPPQTLDEFYEVLKAFKTQDPNRTGKNDAYGFTAQKTAGYNTSFNFVHFAYGLPHGDWVLDEKGKPAPIFEHPAFKQGLTYLRKLWDEKLIDPEFLLNDTQKREEKYYQGKAGVMGAPLFRNLNRLETNLQKVNPQGKLGFAAPPAGPNGKRGMNIAPKSGLFTAVTKHAANPKRAAEFIEFMLSSEGRSLLELGIEGIHYTKDGDKIVYNEEERAKDAFDPNGWSHPLAWGSVVYPLTENYLPQAEPQIVRARESVKIATENIVPNLTNNTTNEEVELGGVLNELFNQYYIDILIGKREIDAGLAELSKKWREQGGEKVLAAVAKEYEAQKKK